MKIFEEMDIFAAKEVINRKAVTYEREQQNTLH